MNKDIWALLTPDFVVNTSEHLLNTPLTNLCIQRNSYINRVYEIEKSNKERLIVKFYRPNRWSNKEILVEHNFLESCFNSEIPVIPPLSIKGVTLFEFEGYLVSFFEKKGGRSTDELTKELWEETGRLLARVHNVGSALTNKERIKWIPNIATAEHLSTLNKLNIIPSDYIHPLSNATNLFIKKSIPLFEKSDLSLIHGDCHFGNIIYRPDEHLFLLDFDDCCVGPVVQDLWMLLPDDVDRCENEISSFIKGYSVFREFDRTSLKLIPALKLMRQIHFASWCAIQSKEDNFSHYFPTWGTTKYWNELTKDIFNFSL